jgi:hypothetical protein
VENTAGVLLLIDRRRSITDLWEELVPLMDEVGSGRYAYRTQIERARALVAAIRVGQPRGDLERRMQEVVEPFLPVLINALLHLGLTGSSRVNLRSPLGGAEGVRTGNGHPAE